MSLPLAAHRAPETAGSTAMPTIAEARRETSVGRPPASRATAAVAAPGEYLTFRLGDS